MNDNDQDTKPQQTETLDLAKVRQSLKGQVLRIRTGLRAARTCGSYTNRHY